jgi:hypothetical protein
MNIKIRRPAPVTTQFKMAANGIEILGRLFQRRQLHFYVPQGGISTVDQCDTIGV